MDKKEANYICKQCNQPAHPPHSGYNGHWYCPNGPGALPYAEWKEKIKESIKKKHKPKEE